MEPEPITVHLSTNTPIPPSEADTSIVPEDKSTFESDTATPELLFRYIPIAFVHVPDFIKPLFLISSFPSPNI